MSDLRTGDPRTGDPRTGDPRTGEARTGEARTGEARITAAVIVRDEAKQMPSLLAALRPADAIVVIDGGSRDGTVEACRALGVEPTVVPFDTFAAQRNRALERVRTDWVLSIDADERPQPGFFEEARLRLAEGRKVAWRVPIRSRLLGRPVRFGGTQDDRPVRLFRRDAARWTGAVHERLEFGARTAGVGLLHRGFTHDSLPDRRAFLAKIDRYTALEAAARVARGEPPRPGERWWGPPRELFRRLLWKGGWADGPAGWEFALGSAYSAWLTAVRHAAGYRAEDTAARPAENAAATRQAA